MNTDEPGGSFGERLRRLRQAAGLTQEQLAERAGLTAKGISALERGERQRPYRHTVQALAEALGLAEDKRDALLGALPSRPGFGPPEAPPPVSGLPVPPTPLVDREQDAARVAYLLAETPVRLVTLTGPGGVGKTRLAIHVASAVAARFGGGPVFVSLASIQEPDLVGPAIAAAFSLREAADLPLDRLLRTYLESKEVLLVLDNFEHLPEAAPEVAGLLAACPRLKVLATSRSRLKLRGEQEYPLKPLALPALDHIPLLDEVKSAPAVELFVQSARAVVPDFNLTQANVTAITAICRRLDGLPLALELAAARLKLLGPTALLARLDRALPLLVDGARDLPERQQTLRRTMAWSYDLLTAPEQQLFRRLAVFAGGWTVEAAGAVCQKSGEPDEVLEGLASLLDKNLVVRPEETADEPRFTFLETIRAYAWELLEAGGEAAQMRQRHALYYRALVEEAGPGLAGPEQAVWLDRLAQEHDNLHSALDWFLARADGESMAGLGWSLWRFWYMRGFIGEGQRWMEQALALLEGQPGPARARALFVLGFMLHERGQPDRAAAAVEESLATAGEADPALVATCLALRGIIKVVQGAYEQAGDYLRQSASRARALGNTALEGVALSVLAQAAMGEGDFKRAIDLLDQAGPLLRAPGALMELSVHLDIRAMIPQLQRDYAQTARLLRESLALSWQLRDTGSMVFALEGLAGAMAGLGQAETAARLFGAAEALRETMGAYGRTSGSAHELYEQNVGLARAQLDPAALERAWQQGRAMPLAEVVALALEGR